VIENLLPKDAKLLKEKQVIIVKNYYPLNKDPRLIKLVKMLKSEGYNITYIGWDRTCSTWFSTKHIECEDYRSIILQANGPFGPKSFPFLPLWWFFLLKWLLRLDWDVGHVVNFPSLIPSIIAAQLKHKPIFYDVEDTYVDQLSALPNFLRILGILIERSAMKLVDAVILVDEMQVEEFRGIPCPNIVVVYDSPPPLCLNSGEDALEKDFFKIFYAGYLSRDRCLNIEQLIEALRDIDGVKIKLAGDGDLVQVIKAKALEMPSKIQYVGWIPYKKVLELSFEADLLFSLRDPNPPVQKYICGSKFLEAVMCGKPILVNMNTSTAAKVMQHKCGIVIDAHNVNEIKEAILKLKNDRDLCKRLGMNGRIAYEQKYSWNLMRQRLLNLYAELIR